MATDIGPKIGIQGEAEFRRELNNINQSIKTLGSEMKVVTSEFVRNENSVEALTAKNDVLGRTVVSLNERLEMQKKMLAESARQYGETDERTLKWQQAVNKTQAEINQYNAEIDKNNALLKNNGKTAEQVAQEQKEAAEKAKEAHEKWETALKNVAAGLAAMATAAVAAVAAVGKFAVDAAYAADGLNTMAKTTGLSTEELQRFRYAADTIDVSLDTLTGSMTKLTGNMAKAQSGSGEAAEAFEALGISVTDGNGELRDRNEVFQETIAALGKMTNETERDATAMKIFGRSAQDLNPLILGGAEALQALGDEAAKAGLILSQDDLDALNTVSDAVDRFKATTSAAGNLFMVGFAAPISEAVNLITGYLQQMTAAFTESGWDGLSETMGAILTDIGDKITEYLPKLVSFGADIINRLALGIAKMLPDIAKAAVEIVTTLITGLFETLPELIPTAVDAILTITETLIDNVDHLVDAAVAIVIALANGLIEALPRLIEKAPEIVLKLVNAIIENVPKVLAAARDLIAMLAQGIYENLRAIWDKGVELVREFIAGIASWLFKVTEQGTEIVSKVEDGLRQKVEDAKQWGRDLINNFVAGITSMIQKVKDTVSSVASTVKDFLGFSEPDKGPLSDFHTYGPDMMKLYAGGIRDNAWRVQDALDTAAAGWSARIKEPELSFADVLSGAVSGMQTAVEGIGGGSYSFTLVLPDGTVLARYMLPTLIDVAQANGTPILNPE